MGFPAGWLRLDVLMKPPLARSGLFLRLELERALVDGVAPARDYLEEKLEACNLYQCESSIGVKALRHFGGWT